MRFLAPAQVAFVGERFRSAPWGALGGASGASMRVRIRPRTGAPWREQSAGFSLALEAGAEVAIETPGGGGYGRSSARRPRRRA